MLENLHKSLEGMMINDFGCEKQIFECEKFKQTFQRHHYAPCGDYDANLNYSEPNL